MYSVYCYKMVPVVFSVVDGIFNEIETSISNTSLLTDFKMTELPNLHDKFIQLIELLVSCNLIIVQTFFLLICPFLLTTNLFFRIMRHVFVKFVNKQVHRDRVVILLQDIVEILVKDMMMLHGCK